MTQCSVQVDKRIFSLGEPIYIVLSNLGDRPLYIGSWGVLSSSGMVVYSTEPPQILIQPLSSTTVVWFQVDNSGALVKAGVYRIFWRPRDMGGSEYVCDIEVRII